MAAAPSMAQLRAQVGAVLAKSQGARAIGIRAARPVESASTLRVHGTDVALHHATSVLEIREQLASLEPGSPPLVIVTEIPEAELGMDVLARLAKRRLHAINLWQVIKERFQARYIDPQLVSRHGWVAEALVESEPERGYPPAPSGFLSAETVWNLLFEQLLGFPEPVRDAESILEWSLEQENRQRLFALDQRVRDGLAEALESESGRLTRTIFECIGGEAGTRALGVGLVCGVLFDPAVRDDPGSIKAVGRLEALLGLDDLKTGDAVAWSDAATATVERLARKEPERIDGALADADRLLDELGAGASAHRSRLLPSGFEQRLERLADEIRGVVEGDRESLPESLSDAVEAARSHIRAELDRARDERLLMVLRLLRWLATKRAGSASQPRSFAEAAAAYRADGGFVDRARCALAGGDPFQPLDRALAQLGDAVSALREAENERFGNLLAGWAASGSSGAGVTGIEDVLDHVVAPLGQSVPVLVLVLDGMGGAAYREIQDDLIEHQWTEIVPEAAPGPVLVIAALPTVTQVCRASLLSGRLTTGGADDEKAGFAAHAALVAVSRAAKAPVVFHKADLSRDASAAVPGEVRAAIADEEQRIVAVVINAIDDHLAKGDQVRVRWDSRTIRPLEALLSEAAAASRAIVVTADHGHVLERGTELHEGKQSARWRVADGAAQPGEIVLEGPRVVVEGGKLIAPWSERIRYGTKRNGYHGGASPQEVVVPLGIFVPSSRSVAGWVDAPPDTPAWWEADVDPLAALEGARAPREGVAAAPPPPVRRGTQPAVQPRRRKAPQGQGTLFRRDPGDGRAAGAPEGASGPPPPERPSAPAVPAAPSPPAAPKWIEQLLASDTLAAQRSRAARSSLSDDRIREILVAFDERGGTMTRVALARRLAVAPIRVHGMVSALRRLLNVDGYQVLSLDDASDTILLNREYLSTQFGI